MKNLKSIAKQWKTITFNQFKAIYNNLKIVDPQDVAKLSGIKIANNEILIMATRKPENPNKLDLILKRLDKIEKRLDHFDAIVKANNLVDPTAQK